jgi:hypothetical protein
VTLTGVQYRGATLNITLHGSGNVISAFKLDGTTTTNTTIPTTLTGTHTVDITLTGGQSKRDHGQCRPVPGRARRRARRT